MGGTAHLSWDVKRPRVDCDAASDRSGGGLAPAGGRATTDQPAFHVGAGVDDIAVEARGPGTRYLIDQVLESVTDTCSKMITRTILLIRATEIRKLRVHQGFVLESYLFCQC